MTQFKQHHSFNVGGGLPPIALLQSCMFWLTHCYRGQAPSHIWISIDQIDPDLLLLLLGLIADLILEAESGQKCGRGLAPDSAASVMHVWADTLLSGASPLPHLDLHRSDRP
ncbi:hypothetical protein C1Y28_29940 [Pseudomonas sp. GW704-F5]|nr:hypothetical protein C1Y28_29940 [Pseudomonas sp. GW704-F5]